MKVGHMVRSYFPILCEFYESPGRERGGGSGPSLHAQILTAQSRSPMSVIDADAIQPNALSSRSNRRYIDHWA